MKRKQCQVLVKDGLHYRKEAFRHGLSVHGYTHKHRIEDPGPGDILCIWNRSFAGAEEAERFERAGARVLVAENGLLGKSFLGGNWYSIAWGHVAGAGGYWPEGGKDRWDALDVELLPWQRGGTETIILGQRGIGERGIKSPEDWAASTQARIGGRIRMHPGKYEVKVTLEDDLAQAACVVTWASSAALLALKLGVPVWHELPCWIGAKASRPLRDYPGESLRDDAARLAVFRKLAWACWRIEEIDSGAAFAHLLLGGGDD